jgi:hypothetical protein
VLLGFNQGNKCMFAVWHLLSHINTALRNVHVCLATVWHRSNCIGRKCQSFLLEEDIESLEEEEKLV